MTQFLSVPLPQPPKRGLLRQTHLCVYSGAPNGEFWSLSSHNFHPNQNYSKILERDWLSPARSEHLQDSARVIPVMKWSNRTVDTLCKWTVSDVVEHFVGLIIVFFLMKTYNWCLLSFSNFVTVLTNWKQEFKSSNSICNHTRNQQIRLPLRGLPILIITRMVTDRIGLHSVLLPLFIAHVWITLGKLKTCGRYVEELSLPHSRVTSHIFLVVLERLMWNTCTHTCSLHSWQRFENESTPLRSA